MAAWLVLLVNKWCPDDVAGSRKLITKDKWINCGCDCAAGAQVPLCGVKRWLLLRHTNTASVKEHNWQKWFRSFIPKNYDKANFFCLSPNGAGGEADHHRWGVPEHPAQEAQRRLWEVRTFTRSHVRPGQSAAFTHSKYVSSTKERKKISRRKWTRSDRRR